MKGWNEPPHNLDPPLNGHEKKRNSVTSYKDRNRAKLARTF